MTTIEQINARAAQVDGRKVALILLMAIPYALGWLARKVVLGIVWAGAWAYAAVAQGWTDAHTDKAEQVVEPPPWMAR